MKTLTLEKVVVIPNKEVSVRLGLNEQLGR